MDTEREDVGHELWALKLKLLEANYEKSKLKIRESSLYCRLSIIQLKNIVDEEKFITEKYEKKAVAERLLVAKEQVSKHAKEKEAISKKSKDDLKKTEEEWKGKITELSKRNEFLEESQEKKEKETQSKKVLIEEISMELDILKKKENDWKTENARLLSKVEIMEKEHEKISKHLAIRKVDKEVQAEMFDVRQVDGGGNGERNTMELTQKSRNIITLEGGRSCHFEKTDEIVKKLVPEDAGESDHNSEDTLSCTSRRKSGRLLKPNRKCVVIGIPSLKETEKVLRSRRRRSQRSRSVSPESNNSDDNTESKRSRMARYVSETICSDLSASKLEKKKRRVTFSGELEIREFDKSKEWEEICQEQSNEPCYLGKLHEKQKLIDDTVASDVLSVETTSDLIQQEVILNDPNQEDEGYQEKGEVKKKKRLRKQRGAQQLIDGASSVASDVLSVKTISDLTQQEVILNDPNQEDGYQESGEVKKKKQLRKQRGAQQLTDGASSVVSDVFSVETNHGSVSQEERLNYPNERDHKHRSSKAKVNRRKGRIQGIVTADAINVGEFEERVSEGCGSSNVFSAKDGKAKCERKNRRKRGRNETVSEASSTGGESAVQRKQAEGVTIKSGAEDKSSEDVLASDVIQNQEYLNDEPSNYSEEKSKRKAKGKAEDRKVVRETPREVVNRPGKGKDGVEDMEEENSQCTSNETESESSVPKEEEHPLNGKRKGKKGTSLSVKNQSRKKDLSLDIGTAQTTRPTRGKRGIPAVPDETKDKGVQQDEDTLTLQVETEVPIAVFPNGHPTSKEASLGNETSDCDEHRMKTRQRGSTRTMAVLREEEEEEEEEREVDVTEETTEQGKRRNTDVIQEECSIRKDISLDETREKDIKENVMTRSRKAKRKMPAINDKSEVAAESPKGKMDGKTSVTRKGRSRNKEAFLNDDRRGNDSKEAEKKVYRTRQRAVKGRIVESSTKVDKKEEEMKGLRETANTLGRDEETVLALNRKASRNETTLNCEQGVADRDNDGEIAAIDDGSEDIEKHEVGERDKTPEESSVEITPVVRKDQWINKGISLNIETGHDGNEEKGRRKVTRQRGSKKGTTERNKEAKGNLGKQEMKDTISEKGKKRRSSLVNEKILSNEAMLKGTTHGGGQKSGKKSQENVSEINNEATGNIKESLGKTSSKLELPSGSSNVTIGQQTASTAVNLQTTLNVSKAAKRRRTLYSNKENSRMMNETNSLFQETLPLNSMRSTGGMPPSLSSFMKAFIVPKLKN